MWPIHVFIKQQTFTVTTYLDMGYKLYKLHICELKNVNAKYALMLVVLKLISYFYILVFKYLNTLT